MAVMTQQQGAITAVEAEALCRGALRVSLVCEQYALHPEALARVPLLQVDSRAGFSAYLADRAGLPPSADLELGRPEG